MGQRPGRDSGSPSWALKGRPTECAPITPLRGCGLQVEISFELETSGQHTFRTLHNTRDSALCNRRFHPFNVYTEKKRREKLNPVRRGLLSSPGDWPWSSWRYC
jgi:hypothetical protein